MQFFFMAEPNILSGLVSLFFAFFAWQAVQAAFALAEGGCHKFSPGGILCKWYNG